MKNQEELNDLKNEVKSLNEKLAELSENELKEIADGEAGQYFDIYCPKCVYVFSRHFVTGCAIHFIFGTLLCPSCNEVVSPATRLIRKKSRF